MTTANEEQQVAILLWRVKRSFDNHDGVILRHALDLVLNAENPRSRRQVPVDIGFQLARIFIESVEPVPGQSAIRIVLKVRTNPDTRDEAFCALCSAVIDPSRLLAELMQLDSAAFRGAQLEFEEMERCNLDCIITSTTSPILTDKVSQNLDDNNQNLGLAIGLGVVGGLLVCVILIVVCYRHRLCTESKQFTIQSHDWNRTVKPGSSIFVPAAPVVKSAWTSSVSSAPNPASVAEAQPVIKPGKHQQINQSKEPSVMAWADLHTPVYGQSHENDMQYRKSLWNSGSQGFKRIDAFQGDAHLDVARKNDLKSVGTLESDASFMEFGAACQALNTHGGYLDVKPGPGEYMV